MCIRDSPYDSIADMYSGRDLEWYHLPCCFHLPSQEFARGLKLAGGANSGVVYTSMFRGKMVAAKQYYALSAAGIGCVLHGLEDDPVRFKSVVGEIKAEIEAFAQLAHPRIVSLAGIAVGEFRGEPTPEFILSEWVDGGNLEEWTESMVPPTEHELIRVGTQILEGLEHIHLEKSVHRNVKPSNIMLVGPTKSVKIADFGFAAVVYDFQGGRKRSLLSTPSYTAPEIWTGERYDTAADLYATGCSLLHAMLREMPAESHKKRASQLNHIASSFTDLSPLVRELTAERVANRPTATEALSLVNMISRFATQPSELEMTAPPRL
eukprot:TRINITY_DN55140_c0_g1_i1.p1 TRINITY_DN55140_c0_g1~~TRINITY_DN55140_c0_g1_i1.p1  ORF type:complete len:322 (-),score=70.64 TRINITY_DN55140_c0_g1_i1:72-1037(-)